MIEIPEAFVLSQQLQDTVCGKQIKNVIAAQSPHGFAFYNGEPSLYPALLNGLTIENCEAVGGMIKMYLQDCRMIFHDGTNLRYLTDMSRLPKKHQLLLEFKDGSCLYCTVQMYGALFAYKHGSWDNPYYKIAREKPNPLNDEFDFAWFSQIVEDAPLKLSVKALLATEQRIPGLGNGCLQDILFRAGLNPQSKLTSLDETDIKQLFGHIKSTLQQMAEQGGRNTEKDIFGINGGYQCQLCAKTLPEPCPKCGSAIVRKAYMGGNVYFCPTCQPLKK